ncbi:MAG TPA: hypothetical protein VMG10_30825 [Gemmataceae bacterium]|nr:hypothetical protein [Gemmataceae bacterium]
MPLSVEKICNELNRNGLLSPPNIRNLRQRWLREAGVSAGDPTFRFPTPGQAAQELRRFLLPT